MELEEANRLMRLARRAFRTASIEEGWSLPVSPVQYLILEQLRSATAFGLTPGRLAHLLDLPPSTLAHHLDRLEESDLVGRRDRGLHDGRRVSVQATREGAYAARRLQSVLRRSIGQGT